MTEAWWKDLYRYNKHNVGANFEQELLDWIEKTASSDEGLGISFYKAEDYFGGKERARQMLMYFFHKFYLEKRFDEDFWAGLIAPLCCPEEAKEICVVE